MTGNASESRRYLALWLPFLSTDRLRRTRAKDGGAPDKRPLVLAARISNTQRIVASDAKAQALGLAPGMTLADARARVPALDVAAPDPAADRALLEQVADGCERYTPLVGLDRPDGIMLDVTGCAHLFGGEAALHADARARLTRLDLTSGIAVAGAPDTARALSRFTCGGVTPMGEDAQAVRPLPIAALGLDAERQVALARAGLRTIADLADRPRAPLAARFGRDLIDRLTRTLGEAGHPISPRRPLPALLAERRFAEPISRSEDVEAALSHLAEELVGLLERQGQGGRCYEASFFRVDGRVRHIRAVMAQAARDAAALMRLFQVRLETLSDPLDAGFGFDLLRLSALATEPLMPAQPRLEDGTTEEDGVNLLLDQLAARFGPRQVVRFKPKDSHVPERAAALVPAASAAGREFSWARPTPGEPPLRPLRLFSAPEPAEALAEVPDGPPLRFRWRRVLHEVTRAEGPERIAPEWWRDGESAQTRDYYRVEDAQGRRFWLYREGLYAPGAGPPRWFVHGLFA